MNALNAILSGSIEEDLGTYLMGRRCSDGFAVTVITVSAHPIREENR
jgi:hypothetical protein